ncbi:MAG: hypothetical protein AB8B52_00805 [Winogradskyella sp.]
MNLSYFIIGVSLLILINVVLAQSFDLQEWRITRSITTVIIFGWFLSFKVKKKLFFSLIFALLLIADLALLDYEAKWFCFLRFITFIIINALLCVHLSKKISVKQLTPFVLVTIFILFVSCIFLAIQLSELIDFTIFGLFHEVLFYTYALSTFLLVLFTVLTSLNDYSKKNDIFLGAIIAFFLSDVLLMIGYYEQFYLAFQIDCFFHILAMALLIYYVVLCNDNTAEADSGFIN